MLSVLHETVKILHDVRRRYPLGKSMCTVTSAWMFTSLHLASDFPKTRDQSIIVWYLRCRRIFSYWLYAAVRYSYKGQLGEAVLLHSGAFEFAVQMWMEARPWLVRFTNR